MIWIQQRYSSDTAVLHSYHKYVNNIVTSITIYIGFVRMEYDWNTCLRSVL